MQFVGRGSFHETRLHVLSGRDIADEHDFLQALAERLMNRYEHFRRQPTLLVLHDASVDRRARTKSYYHRLFDQAGDPAAELATVATETLAEWIESSLDGVPAYANPVHTTDPAYDVLSFIRDRHTLPVLRLSQVKCTAAHLPQNCNLALHKFALLDSGAYQADLLGRLEQLEHSGQMPPGYIARDLVFSRQHQYRIYAFHSQHRDTVSILTTYHDKIPGDPERRTARFIHITNLSTLWTRLGKLVYAQLS